MKRDEALRLRAERSSFAPKGDDWEALWDGMGGDPWRVIVAAIVGNDAKRLDAASALLWVLRRWPNPEALAKAHHLDIAAIFAEVSMKDTGQRARALTAMSARWLTENWQDVRDLPGVGMRVAGILKECCK